MSNIQLKGNHPAAPWLVVEGTLQEIAEQLMSVFPTLSAEDPTQLPSLVQQARELWAAQMTVAEQLGGQEVAVERQAPQPQAWGQTANRHTAQPAPAAAAPGGAPIDQFGNAMVWKQGTSKAGKAYKGWFPNYPKGDPRGEQVEVQWVR